ncbi:MAG: hypothetical protein GY822_02480 [Deltaproteobacteria bacterium]|nr:hypothetical protein [Deltaproteobacteria bacterium]
MAVGLFYRGQDGEAIDRLEHGLDEYVLCVHVVLQAALQECGRELVDICMADGFVPGVFTHDGVKERVQFVGEGLDPRATDSQRCVPIGVTYERDMLHVDDAMCLRGMCMMLEDIGEAEPRVEKVLPDFPAPVRLPTWITSHRDLKSSRRIRLVFDLLVERFSGELELA